MPEASTNPVLTADFKRALEFAFGEFGSTDRKGGNRIPYFAHLMSVAALVLEAGGDQDCAIAAVLHDAIEDPDDGEAIAERIRTEFGDKIERAVRACSDAVGKQGQEKPPWRPRKEKYLQRLQRENDRDVLLISVCDKLHNARAIVADLRAIGETVWQRFNAGCDDQLWYYRSLATIYTERGGADGDARLSPVAEELTRVLETMEELARKG